MAATKKQRWTWLGGTVALFVVGAVVGLVLGNVWLGLVLALIVSLVWLISAESSKGGNTGVNDESHGIEL